MSPISAETDLADLFNFDLVSQPDPAACPSNVLCGKCHGRGNFIGYTGRVVGKCFTCDGSGLAKQPKAASPTAQISVEAIAVAFAAARAAGIKSPKLRLDSFTFSRAPDAGRNAGAIYVKDAGEYIGKVVANQFHPTFTCDDATKARVIEVAANPHQAARAYGAKTGSCSCCGRELTNQESIALGIGPICLGKFGWGA